MRFDLIVVGGGPAGCAAAISAARAGRRVALFERGGLPRHKVCGEFVSPEAVKLLSTLLGADAPLLARAPRFDRARLFAEGAVIETRLARAAAAITRYDLDYALWQAARAAGVDCREHVTVERAGESDAGRGELQVVTSAETFAAARVINAAGRWSKLGKPARHGEAAIGLKAHVLEAQSSPSIDLHFFDEGYCGVLPVGEGRLNVCALIKNGGLTSIERVWARIPELEERAARWVPVERGIATSPLIFSRPRPVQDRMLAAGDAAGFVDPFIGDGIALALTTGIMAAAAADAAAYAQEYEHRILRVFRAAASLRALTGAPPLIRRAALASLRIPSLAHLAFDLTRPRA